MTLAQEKYVSTATFRRSGEAVATATWIVPLDDGRVGFWTSSSAGKAKRLRNNPQLTLQPCDSRGRTRAASPVVHGTASLVVDGPDFDTVQRRVREKYGVMVPISRLFNTLGHVGRGSQPYGDLVVLVTLSS